MHLLIFIDFEKVAIFADAADFDDLQLHRRIEERLIPDQALNIGA